MLQLSNWPFELRLATVGPDILAEKDESVYQKLS